MPKAEAQYLSPEGQHIYPNVRYGMTFITLLFRLLHIAHPNHIQELGTKAGRQLEIYVFLEPTPHPLLEYFGSIQHLSFLCFV